MDLYTFYVSTFLKLGLGFFAVYILVVPALRETGKNTRVKR